MKQDISIFELLREEEERQTSGLELIASENYVSKQVLDALGSICTNKYAEGYPNARYYGGCEIIDKIEQLAIDRLCQIYGAEYANVQPHSGAQANMAVMMACLKPGETFMGLDLAHGGHLTHGSPVNMSGILSTMPCLTALTNKQERLTTTQWRPRLSKPARNSSSAVLLPIPASGTMRG